MAGILLSILFLQVVESLMEYIRHVDSLEDGAYLFQPLFDIRVLFPIYVITFLVALGFQFFLTLRVWKIYKQGQKIFNLKVWQLVTLCCVLFGLSFGFIVWHSRSGTPDLSIEVLIGTMLAVVYWTGNLITLSIFNRMSID